VVARKNIQTYKYGEKQQKAKEKTASKCRLSVMPPIPGKCIFKIIFKVFMPTFYQSLLISALYSYSYI